MTDEMNIVEQFDTTEVLAKLVRHDDGTYHVIDKDGTEGPACKIVENGFGIALTPNAANRLWINHAKADKLLDENEYIPLYYKPTRKLGPKASHLPNAKLISYLSEDLQAEYKAIIDRARAAMEADKKKPMTALEKAQAALERAQANLDKLLAKEDN
jgi:hypothetical protein